MRNRFHWRDRQDVNEPGRFVLGAGVALVIVYIVMHLAVAGAIFAFTPLGNALASHGDITVTAQPSAANVCPVSSTAAATELRHAN